MAESRTVKVLGALLLAMTLGAIVLMAMQTSPIRPPASLGRRYAVRRPSRLRRSLRHQRPPAGNQVAQHRCAWFSGREAGN